MDANGGRPLFAAASKYVEGAHTYGAVANENEHRFRAFFAAHCEMGVDMHCPLNEIVAAVWIVMPIPYVYSTTYVTIVGILLERAGIEIKGVRSIGQPSEYMYCVGMRLKSFPK